MDLSQGIWVAKELFTLQLNEILVKLLSEPGWALETLININCAFSLFNEIILDCREKSCASKGVTSLQNVTTIDINEVIFKILDASNKRIEINKNLFSKYDRLKPIHLLILAEQNNIDIIK